MYCLSYAVSLAFVVPLLLSADVAEKLTATMWLACAAGCCALPAMKSCAVLAL